MQQARAMRPLGLMEIVDHSFRLYRSNFWLFFGIVVILELPMSCFQGWLLAEFARLAQRPGDVNTRQLIAYGIGFAAFIAVYLFFAVITSVAATKAVSDVYMSERTGLGRAYGYVFRRFPSLFGTLVVVTAFTLAGFGYATVAFIAQQWVVGALFCFPGVAFAVWAAFLCGFVTQVFVVEHVKYFRSIGRSWFLMGKGTWAEWLVINIVISFLAGIATLPVTIAVMIFTALGKISPELNYGISSVAGGLASAFFTPLQYIAIVLLYYTSRMRKEGFDLEILAREMGKALPPGPPQPTAASKVVWPTQSASDTTAPGISPATPQTDNEGLG